MNARRKSDKAYCVEAQQKAMSKVFVAFRVVIAILVAIAAACVYFALTA